MQRLGPAFLFFFFFSALWPAQAQDSPPLLLADSRQTLPLNAQTPQHELIFSSQAGQIWSFSAVPLGGTGLDPVLRILGPDGAELAANDNENRRGPAARLEAWTAPAAGDYTLELSRESANRAAGEVILTALSGPESLPLGPLPIPEAVSLNPGQVYPLAQAPDPEAAPLRIRFRLPEENAARLGLQMWSGELGDWLLVISAEGLTLQATRAREGGEAYEAVLADVDMALGGGDYEILLSPEQLRLSVGGEAIFTGEAEALLPGFRFWRGDYQALRLLAMPNNAGPLSLSRPFAAAPFYTPAQALSLALPPAPPGQRLYEPAGPPLALVQALRAGDWIGPGGGLSFSIPEGLIETSDLGYSTYPLALQKPTENFVLSVQVAQNGPASTACGLSLRENPAGDFMALLVNGGGQLYLLPYQAGELGPDYVAQASPWIDPTPGAYNQITLLMQGEGAQVFINGYWAGSSPALAGAGGISFLAVLEDAGLARCSYRNLWLWELP
jgi:hypothetical protein